MRAGWTKAASRASPAESNCTVRNRRCHFWRRNRSGTLRTVNRNQKLYTVYAINYLQAEACGCTLLSPMPTFQVLRDEAEVDDEDDDNDTVVMLMTR